MNFKILEEKKIEETDEYKVFSEEIDYLIDFFCEFSDLIFSNGRVISFLTETKYYSLNTSLIESSTNTLRSIKLCCSIGSFSDANILVRKLRDDLVQYVYILNIINLRKPFTDESLKEINIDSPELFAESFKNLRFNLNISEDEQAVSAWFANKVSDLKRSIKKKLEFENYMNVLAENDNISKILIDYNLKEYWQRLRRRLNDYVHNNGTKFSIHNCISTADENFNIHFKNIVTRTNYIASFFLIVLSMVDSTLFMSSDYIDHLDCNLEPPKNSQYAIANFIQEFIDIKITKLHPELKQYLKEHNINGMKID